MEKTNVPHSKHFSLLEPGLMRPLQLTSHNYNGGETTVCGFDHCGTRRLQL